MENESQTRNQRGRTLRWIGVGIVLAVWGMVRLWQRRGVHRGCLVAPYPEEPLSPVSPVEVEPESIEIPITLEAPEPLPEPEASPSPVLAVDFAVPAETTAMPAGTLADAVVPVADNLCRIAGIGPKVATLLGAAGVSTFAELAVVTPERLRELLQAAGLRFMDPDTWSQQAALAARSDWKALAALQAELKGGRRI